jgi:DNA/RNA-binding protein KIN17
MTGEERERKMLEDQITRAREAAEAAEKDHIPAELQKREGEKITLNLFGNAPAPAPPAGETNPDSTAPSTGAEASSTAAAPTSEAGPSKPTFSFGSFSSTSTPTPPVANPLKRPAPMNVFKSAKIPKGDLDGTGGPMKQKPLSEVERLMKEDQARKMNKTAGRGGYQGHGPRRG